MTDTAAPPPKTDGVQALAEAMAAPITKLANENAKLKEAIRAYDEAHQAVIDHLTGPIKADNEWVRKAEDLIQARNHTEARLRELAESYGP